MSNSGSVIANGVNFRLLFPLFAGMLLFASTVMAADPPPTAPANPVALAATSTSISWSWQDLSSDESGFIVWTDPGAVTPSTLSTTVPADTVSWAQPGLAANSLYSFQMAATNIYGTSAKTEPITSWTLAATPVEPVIKTEPAFEVAVGANDGNPAETVYAIECTTLEKWVQADGNLGASPLFQTAAAWGSVALTGLAPGTTYTFGVSAQNGAGLSTVLGSEASGTTMADVSVPNVVGQTQAAASTLIVGANLVVGTITQTYSATVSAGKVISQTPSAGESAAPGTAVLMVVSKGAQPVITGYIIINKGALATNNPNVTLKLTWSSNAVRMRFSDNGSNWTAWEPLQATRAYTLPAGEGYKTVRVQFLDIANNRSVVYSSYIRVDTTPPAGTIAINNGARASTSLSATLGLAWSDTGSGVTSMRFSADGKNWTVWEPVAAIRAYTLPGPAGTYSTIRVQYRDLAGNYSAVASDYIFIQSI
jgi:hypothetical protein